MIKAQNFIMEFSWGLLFVFLVGLMEALGFFGVLTFASI